MFQAITTKYLAPTNHRGARIKATAAAGSITVSWDYSTNSVYNHYEAAKALANKFDWLGTKQVYCGYDKYELVGGGLPKADGCAWVLIPKR